MLYLTIYVGLFYMVSCTEVSVWDNVNSISTDSRPRLALTFLDMKCIDNVTLTHYNMFVIEAKMWCYNKFWITYDL